MKQVSIYKIAGEAGVSPATVSRVISGAANVREDKRKRVEEVIRKYDYRPNVLAQGLSRTNTGVIGFIAADLENPYYGRIVHEFEKEIDRRGFTPVICGSICSYEREVRYLEKLFDMRADAIVLAGGKSDELVTDPEYADLINRISDSIPIITTGKVDGARCYQVCIDEMAGVDLAMDHLLSLGHTNIALLNGYAGVKSTYEKRVRYRSILKKQGLPYREEYIIDGGYNIEGGHQTMRELLKRVSEGLEPPTAIIAINDFSAVGVLQSLQENGSRVPEDCSVMSFDNTFISVSVRPRLTSIGYNYELFGQSLAETAIDLAEGKEAVACRKIPSTLHARESTAGI